MVADRSKERAQWVSKKGVNYVKTRKERVKNALARTGVKYLVKNALRVFLPGFSGADAGACQFGSK